MAITVPDVPEQPVPSVRIQPSASLETFGGGAGLEGENQEIQKIASSGGEIAAFEKIKADQTAYQEAAAKLSDRAQNILYDPQNGVLSSQGVNALPAHDKGWADFRKSANEISSTLHGPEQVGSFNKYALTLGQEFNRTAMAHASTQLEKHADQSFDAFVKNTTNFAAMSYGDPMTRARSLQSIDNAVTGYAARKGLDDDQTQLMRSNVHSNFHEQQIDMMLNDPKMAPMAKDYFAQNKDDIDIATRERLQGTLAEGDTRYGSQVAVQSILQKHSDSESDALHAADKIDDADQRDMARKMITAKFGQDRQAQRNDQDNTFMHLGQMVDNKKLTDPADIRNAIPAAQWNQLREDQRTALLKRGEDTVTSINKWTDFKEAVKDGTLKDMSRADIEAKYLPYMSPGDKKTVVDQWLGTQKGADNPKLLRDQSVEQTIDTSASSAGLVNADSKKRSSGDKLMLKSIQDNVHRDIVGFESSQKKSPQPDEIQSIIDKRTIQAIGQKPTGWFGGGHGGDTPYESIPEKAREQAVQLARSGGWIASRKNIEKAFQLHRQGMNDDQINKALK